MQHTFYKNIQAAPQTHESGGREIGVRYKMGKQDKRALSWLMRVQQD